MRIISFLLIIFIFPSNANASNCPKGTYFNKNKLKCVPIKWIKNHKKKYILTSVEKPSLPQIDNYPPEARKWILRANSAFKRKQFFKSGSFFKKAVNLHRDRNLILIMADAFKRGGKIKSTIESYEDFIINFPGEKNIAEVKKQFSQFEVILEKIKACTAGVLESCDAPKTFLEKVCSSDYPGFCVELAKIYKILKKNSMAVSNLKTGCENQSGEGCFLLAVANGSSRSLFQKACVLEFQPACEKLKELDKPVVKPQLVKIKKQQPVLPEKKKPAPEIRYQKIISGLLLEASLGVNGEVGKDLYYTDDTEIYHYCSHDSGDGNQEYCQENAAISLTGLVRVHKYIFIGGNIYYGLFKRLTNQVENFMLNINLEGRLYQYASDKLWFYGLLQIGSLHRIINDSVSGESSNDTYMNAIGTTVGGGFSYLLNWLSIGVQAKFIQPVWIDNKIESPLNTAPDGETPLVSMQPFTTQRTEFRHYYIGITVSFYLPM
ncbi:MAG: hypothetical protein JXR95_12990 [Deltaproteobacteria bacterium]|nr:hypothetical protein [Deltaproteobacteria bacterium]